jgi:hypothetical protein
MNSRLELLVASPNTSLTDEQVEKENGKRMELHESEEMHPSLIGFVFGMMR